MKKDVFRLHHPPFIQNNELKGDALRATENVRRLLLHKICTKADWMKARC
jgi:hypothetical protein